VPVNTKEDAKGTRRSKIIKHDLNETQDHMNAYIVFSTEAEAAAAMAHNMELVDGRHIRVDGAARPSAHTAGTVEYDTAKSVFIGNLPFNTTVSTQPPSLPLLSIQI
jgi:hypothetical protein